MMKSQGVKHGGKREGAGRKPKAEIKRSVRYTFMLTPEERKQLDEYAAIFNKEASDVVRKALYDNEIIKIP